MSQGKVRQKSSITRSSSDSATKIAFIQSSWHEDIVDKSRHSFLKTFEKETGGRFSVQCFNVPGAFEIPLQAKLLAQSGRYEAIVGAGFVVDGGIYRHEFVAAAVVNALMEVQLETEVPIISLVLTPQRFHEHEAHRTFFRDHFIKKGHEAAIACAATIQNIRAIRHSLTTRGATPGTPSVSTKMRRASG